MDEREHHVLTAVRIPGNSTLPHKHSHPLTNGRTSLSDSLLQLSKDSHDDVSEQAVPLSPTDTETTSAGSVGEDEEGEQDDVAQVSCPRTLTTVINTFLDRTSGGRLLWEPVSRKSVDMWTL